MDIYIGYMYRIYMYIDISIYIYIYIHKLRNVEKRWEEVSAGKR